MRRDREGWFHVAVTAALVLLAKAMGGGKMKRKENGDGILRVEFAMR